MAPREESRKERKQRKRKENYAKHKEAILARHRNYRKLKPWIYNKKRDRTEYCKEHYRLNCEEHKAKSKAWYHANKARAKATRIARRGALKVWHKNYNKKNREKLNEKSKRWQKANRDKVNASFRKRYNASEQLRLAWRLRSRIRSALKRQRARKCASSADLLGCSIADAKAIIESRMIHPMTWLDFMNGRIELDHKVPVSKFDLTDPDQQRKCFGIDNIQPLWWWDNLSKSDKLPA